MVSIFTFKNKFHSFIELLFLISLFSLSAQMGIIHAFSNQTEINGEISDITQHNTGELISNNKDQNPNIMEQLDSSITNELVEYSDDFIINITKNGQYQTGYNLITLERRTKGQLLKYLMIISTEGDIIANKTLHPNAMASFYPAHFINSTTVLLGNGALDGATLWHYKTDTMINLNIRGTHEYEYNSKDETIFTIRRYEKEGFWHDSIEEYTLNGEKIWEKKTEDFIPVEYMCSYCTGNEVGHGNSLFYNPEEETIIFNARNVNTFYKINHTNGEIIWALGEYGDFQLFDENGNQKESLFYHAHSVEQISDDAFILFDNDLHNKTNQFNERSRIVEITINEKTMTANVSWMWEGDEYLYSRYWGDAARLPNGNRLGAFGFMFGSDYELGSRLIEVNEEGDIVWEMNFAPSKYEYGFYRAERFNFKPIITPQDEIIGKENTSIDIEWEVFYNIKTKSNISGSYELYINDTVIEQGKHEFNKFWQESFIRTELPPLELGYYNVSLVLFDESGHFSMNSLNLSIMSYHIEREGPLEIEKGQNNSIITWKGFTSSPLSYELFINDVKEAEQIWEGEDIYYDLNKLTLGDHNLKIVFYNGSNKLFDDYFKVQIFPFAAPYFIEKPKDHTIFWNDSLVLEWEIFDNTPREWILFINNKLLKKNVWTEKNISITWTVPNYNEGLHNISLVAYDNAGLKTISSVHIEILPPPIPVIIDITMHRQLKWGESKPFVWEVHGGKNWTLSVNNAIYSSGSIHNFQISLIIDEWDPEIFNFGVNNLSLQVDGFDYTSSFRNFSIKIVYETGDPYANELIESMSIFYSNGKNVLGEPNGRYARIFRDYANGYITLDMGESEEIIDKEGYDFIVYSPSGYYQVLVTDNLSKSFKQIGEGEGNTQFDLSSIDINVVRYVRLALKSTDEVHIDAIEAYHYNSPIVDREPIIYKDEEQKEIVIRGRKKVMIEWNVFDDHPKNYSIYVNFKRVEFERWDGNNITFAYYFNKTGTMKVKLIVFNMFGNYARDKIIVHVISLIGKLSPLLLVRMLIGGLLLSSFAGWIYMKKKQDPRNFLYNK